MKLFHYLAFAIGIILCPVISDGHVNTLARTQQENERLTDNGHLKWEDAKGHWDQQKQFIHIAGVVADLFCHQPAYKYFPSVCDEQREETTYNSFIPVSEKFINHTYQPPPKNK